MARQAALALIVVPAAPSTPTVASTQFQRGDNSDAAFLAVHFCESSDIHGNTGNGYYGAFQFDVGTWQGNGGVGLASDNTWEEQLRIAKLVQSKRGWAPWPSCARQLGLL